MSASGAEERIHAAEREIGPEMGLGPVPVGDFTLMYERHFVAETGRIFEDGPRAIMVHPDSAIGQLWRLGGRQSISIVGTNGETVTYSRPEIGERGEFEEATKAELDAELEPRDYNL